MLYIVASYPCMQFQGTLINQTWENNRNSNFGPKFGPPNFFLWIFLLIDIRHCCKLSFYAISRKTNDSNFRPYFGTFFFFDNLTLSVTRYHGMVSYHHVQHQKKIMIQFWENLVMDGRTDRRTDELTDWLMDESDFIGCCSTYVEHPKWISKTLWQWTAEW